MQAPTKLADDVSASDVAQMPAMPTAALLKNPASSASTTPAQKVRRPRITEKEHRIHGQPAFVLHSYPYKETSLIVDMFSRDYGRVALVAKGAKRPHSTLRGVLQTFQPLSVSWSGKTEVRTLTGAE